MGVHPRLNRLFRADGKCLAIALDHALFNEVQLLDGVEKLVDLVPRIARSSADAILLSLGQAHHLQGLRLDHKPALLLRADVSNAYSQPRPEYAFSQLFEGIVEQAITLDASAVLLNLFLVPDNPNLYHQCVENICRIKPDCDRFGVPLILEPLILESTADSSSYSISGDFERVRALTRHAVELGAHIVKSDPSDSPGNYSKIVEVAGGVPLLPRGGGKVNSQDILQRTYDLISAGASGIVYGRNIFQHSDVEGMIRAVSALVHEGVTVGEARGLIKEG